MDIWHPVFQHCYTGCSEQIVRHFRILLCELFSVKKSNINVCLIINIYISIPFYCFKILYNTVRYQFLWTALKLTSPSSIRYCIVILFETRWTVHAVMWNSQSDIAENLLSSYYLIHRYEPPGNRFIRASKFFHDDPQSLLVVSMKTA